MPLYELVHDDEIVGMSTEIGQTSRTENFRLLGFWRDEDDLLASDDGQLLSELENMRMARIRIDAC